MAEVRSAHRLHPKTNAPFQEQATMDEDLVELHAFIYSKTKEKQPDLRLGVNQPPVQDLSPSAVTDDHTVEYK